MNNMDRETLQKRIDAVPVWYHAIELAPGVVTPGEFDMRPFIDEYQFPDSFAGLTVVDVGASNGLFSFLFENRGADKVVAVDLESVADRRPWRRAGGLPDPCFMKTSSAPLHSPRARVGGKGQYVRLSKSAGCDTNPRDIGGLEWT
jgi:hypothetical protein